MSRLLWALEPSLAFGSGADIYVLERSCLSDTWNA